MVHGRITAHRVAVQRSAAQYSALRQFGKEGGVVGLFTDAVNAVLAKIHDWWEGCGGEEMWEGMGCPMALCSEGSRGWCTGGSR